jgi:hypothetical protein
MVHNNTQCPRWAQERNGRATPMPRVGVACATRLSFGCAEAPLITDPRGTSPPPRARHHPRLAVPPAKGSAHTHGAEAAHGAEAGGAGSGGRGGPAAAYWNGLARRHRHGPCRRPWAAAARGCADSVATRTASR